ncbi:phosphatidate cytidylyltransferase [Curtanaerobium respiraculi]|uniref:phosphatidate cytidylyltransferase n=1 Tax=Curtanaerobium respiraculi TaxID=2949669 RepID=UPI0024B37855|nr:phosphatidate cytidylyltransferase [Curtanaerobium respiraculi]
MDGNRDEGIEQVDERSPERDAADDPLHALPRGVKRKRFLKEKKNRAKTAAYNKTPDRFKNATSLQVRFRTGLVYVVVTLIAVMVNDVTTMLYLALVAAVCAGEFYYMMRVDSKMPNEFIGVIGAAAYPIAMWHFGSIGVLMVGLFLMMGLFIWYVYWMHARVADVAISFFGASYTGLLLSPLILIRSTLAEPWGGVLLLVLFMSVWMNDVGAYLIGSRFGKHKLAPRTSPKKSWEGLIAGLVVSAAFWCLMVFIPGISISVPQAIAYGLICGSAGVLGDLTESRIKRNVGVKDSGTIMPGHGGLLDRCDSLFFASVTAALLLLMGGCVPHVW